MNDIPQNMDAVKKILSDPEVHVRWGYFDCYFERNRADRLEWEELEKPAIMRRIRRKWVVYRFLSGRLRLSKRTALTLSFMDELELFTAECAWGRT